MYLGGAPSTKETLLDFREEMSGHLTFTSFRELTSSQRTLEIWGVIAWYQSLGIRIPRELGFG